MQKDSSTVTTDLSSDYEVKLDLDLVRQKELVLPALLFLQGNQPLALVSGQLVHFAAPVLSILAPNWLWDRWARLLSNPKELAQLLENLEESP